VVEVEVFLVELAVLVVLAVVELVVMVEVQELQEQLIQVADQEGVHLLQDLHRLQMVVQVLLLSPTNIETKIKCYGNKFMWNNTDRPRSF
jgi:hypothetical protein